MSKMRYWLPAVIYMAIIFILSSQTRVHVSDVYIVQFMVFKSLHIIEYGILYILLYRAFRNTRHVSEWQNIIDAFLIAAAYGFIDEVHQVFVPTREGRMRDVFIDIIGVSAAAIYIWKYLRKSPSRLKTWAKKLQII